MIEQVKALLLLSLIVVAAPPAAAQQKCDLIFAGEIIDNHDDQALAGALVKLGQQSTLTNSDGVFTLNNLCPGTYQLHISHLQCEPLIRNIEVKSSSNNNTFFLEHHAEELEQIDLEANAKRGELAKASITLNKEDLANKTGKTFGALLENTPGVSLLKTGSTIAKPVLNGLHSQRILLVNNGIRMEGQQWGAEHAPEIDPFSVQRLSVIKGAGSVEYGADGLGGVILVEPSKLPDSYGIQYKPSIFGFSNGRGFGTSIDVQGKKKIGIPLSFQLQGSAKKVGNLRGPDYFLDNTGVQETNYMARLGYVGEKWGTEIRSSIFNTELGILTDSHIGNEADLLRVIENGEPLVDRGFTYDLKRPRQDILHEISQWKTYLNSAIGEFNLNLSRQYNRRSEFDRFENKPGLNLKTETYVGDLTLQHAIGEKFNGKIGGQLLFTDFRSNGFYLIPEHEQEGLGIFAYERFFATDKLTLEAGARYDYKRYTYFIPFQEFRRLNDEGLLYSNINEAGTIGTHTKTFNDLVTGSVGASYDVNDNASISFFSGIGARQPLPNELFSDGVHHGTALWEVGNINLGVERAWTNQLNLGLRKENWNFSSTLFLNQIDNYAYLIPDQDFDPIFTIRGSFPQYVTTQSDVQMLGFDYDVQHVFNERLSASTNGAFLWAEDKTLNEPLIFMPANRLNHSIQYNYSDTWGATITATNVFEQGRIPDPSVLDDYIPPPDAYSLLGFQANFAPKSLNNKLQTSLVVDNVLNTDYRDYLDRFRYFAQAPGINAALRLNYTFKTP